MGWVADYSLSRPGAATLQAAGCTGVIRYLFPGRTDGANITPEEIADFNAHHLPYGIVMEAEATWILRGYQQGFDLARQAETIERSLGIPPGVTYAAADFDVQPGQFQQALTTLHGMADGYGSWSRVGVYGSKSFCEWVGANSPITKFWSTDAWSNYTPAANAVLHQHAQWPQGVPVVQGCDHNLILGDWAPRTVSTDWFDMATAADLETVVRKVLNEGTGAGQQNWATTSKAVLATLQGVVNILNTIAKSQSTVLVGGNGIDGVKQVKDAVDALNGVIAAIPGGGSVDPAPIVAGVVDGVKQQFAKAAS